MLDPLAIEGFYATRLLARRFLISIAVLILVLGCVLLSAGSIIGVAVDVLFVALVLR